MTIRAVDKIAAIKPKLTPEFLETLAEVARVDYGMDHVATHQFVRAVFDMAEQEMPDITPYSFTAGYIFEDGSISDG